jgi:hypothetical protein
MEFRINNQTKNKIILSSEWGSIPFISDETNNYESLLSVDGKNVFKFTIRFVNYTIDEYEDGKRIVDIEKHIIRPNPNEIECIVCNDDILKSDGTGSSNGFYCCWIDGSKVYFRFSFIYVARYLMIYTEYYTIPYSDRRK